MNWWPWPSAGEPRQQQPEPAAPDLDEQVEAVDRQVVKRLTEVHRQKDAALAEADAAGRVADELRRQLDDSERRLAGVLAERDMAHRAVDELRRDLQAAGDRLAMELQVERRQADGFTLPVLPREDGRRLPPVEVDGEPGSVMTRAEVDALRASNPDNRALPAGQTPVLEGEVLPTPAPVKRRRTRGAT